MLPIAYGPKGSKKEKISKSNSRKYPWTSYFPLQIGSHLNLKKLRSNCLKQNIQFAESVWATINAHNKKFFLTTRSIFQEKKYFSWQEVFFMTRSIFHEKEYFSWQEVLLMTRNIFHTRSIFHDKKYFFTIWKSFSTIWEYFSRQNAFLRLFIWLELGTFHDEKPRQNVYKYLRNRCADINMNICSKLYTYLRRKEILIIYQRNNLQLWKPDMQYEINIWQIC